MVRFDSFELDVRAGQLRRDGCRVNLPPQQFRILEVMTTRPGALVTRDELRRALWGDDNFVDFNAGLNFCIGQLRIVLGDEAAHPRYIETVPRRGYRFIAPVQVADDRDGFTPKETTLGTPPGSPRPGLWMAAVVGVIALGGLGIAAWTATRSVAPPPSMTAQNQRIADAHAALGFVALNDQWDWQAAEQSLLRAITLDPNHEVALISLSRLRSAESRTDEALAYARRAATAWPESARARANLGWTLLFANQPADAIVECRAALSLRPSSLSDRQCVLNAHVDQGDAEQALEDFTQVATAGGAPASVAEELKQRFRAAGVAGLWQWRLEEMKRRPRATAEAAQEGMTYSLAVYSARLGRTDEALAFLRQAVADSRRAATRRPDAYMFLRVHPAFAALRLDPDFVSLAKELGLPDL